MNSDSLYLNKLKFDPKLNRGVMHFLIHRVRIVMLLILSLVIAGTYSFATLPRELNPEIDIPYVMVATGLPGASPVEVERTLTKPIESSLNDLSEIDTLTSTSDNSFSRVMIQFSSRIDTDQAVLDVKERIDRISGQFPDNATEPRVQKLDFSEQPVLTVAIAGKVNRVSLAETARDLQNQLESKAPISRVDISGALTERVKIVLDADKLSSLGISPNQVSQAIQANNLSFPAGTIEIAGTEYTVNLDNQFQDISQVQNLMLNVSGASIPLSQIADVYYDYDDNNSRAYNITSQGRENAIQLSVFKTPNATIFAAADTTLDLLDSYLSANPELEYVEVLNLSQNIKEQFNSLTNSFTSTILLVFVILLGFLGLRQATTASIAIPLTFLSAFLIMQLTGISLNFLSLFSLLLALGLVVDNAIVVVEATNQYRKKFSADQAGLLVYRDFVVPIWTATLTTVWAFLPLLLATGIIGEFIKSIPIVVTATLISSTTIAVFINIPLTVIFSHTNWPKRVKVFLILLGLVILVGAVVFATSGSPLTPLVLLAIIVFTLLAFLARRQLGVKLLELKYQFRARLNRTGFKNINLSKITSQGLISIDPLVNFYQSVVNKLLESKSLRYKLYGFAVLFVIGSLLLPITGLLRNEFFPLTDSDNIYVSVESPLGTGLDYTESILQQVEAKVRDLEGIESVLTITGSGFNPNAANNQSGLNYGYVSIKLVDKTERSQTSMELSEQLRGEFTDIVGANVQVVELAGGPPAGADLQINLKGDDLAELERISQDIMSVVENIEGSVNVQSSLVQTAGEILVELDPLAMASRGLSAAQVGASLRTAISGSEVTNLQLGDDDTDIQVIMIGSDTSLTQLAQMPLSSPQGTTVLSDIATLRLATSPVSIERENEKRVVRITAAATAGTSAQDLLSRFESAFADYQMPTGYTWDVGGINQENQSSVNSILMAMSFSALLILITLVVQLESFRQSALVMLVIPLAVAGVLFNFTILRIPLSFPALIGVLALFGIVVNNSIILMDKINQNMKFGLKIKDSIIDAATSRLQPILLTSLTTTAGLLPITFSDPLWRGLGGAIIAGLTVSGTLILILLPSLYYEVYGEKGGK